ncbi:winged helix-turn-helix domain-containing protein [Sedimentitalea sp. JM2-8]|uniref:Winged helix-turn-helix domain-containing protein n=1 Tax=Sedimentitalea xiamensis TaxID=3050037 RepID=A0ABT7FFU8_9RHOB|nr:winged helix-turn-helix domain-containing protein [Sedimentitalea xiamensis]MDK3074006.1 winged helix-turn-helix domain-containing protein [Sedimentitalea xiamensis]
MIYAFENFEVDPARAELRKEGRPVHIEPQVFQLIHLLVTEPDRVVTKDELFAGIWGDRIVSDAALSSRIRDARKALDDDGSEQRLIKTVQRRGFRFVGILRQSALAGAAKDAPPQEPVEQAEGTRPSIAVLPFRRVGQTEDWGAIAEAVPAELISSLSRLRWLRVLARGSAFRFRDPLPDLSVIRSSLGATYCLAGDVEIIGPRVAISVELSDTRDGRVIWCETLSGGIDDIHRIRTDIVRLVCSGLELHINIHETERARLRPPESLDAWSLYHLGLNHMYRFNGKDNAIAADYFAKATRLDPGFARAFAARSFTCFQAAFVNYSSNRKLEVENARRFAERCLEIDPTDPFGNFNFGRSFWLNGDHEAGQTYLARSIGMSPSFAHGLYARSHAEMIAGQGAEAIASADEAIALSPLDPFLYAMRQAKAMALLHLGDYEEACRITNAGAREPGSHYIVTSIAAAINKVSGKESQARHWADRTIAQRPDASIAQFFSALPLRDPGVRGEVYGALKSLGFPET